MGEALQYRSQFRLPFNQSVHIVASNDKLSEDPGALLLRRVATSLGLDTLATKHLVDARDPDTITYSLVTLMRTAVLLIAQGWNDLDDADRLRDDPLFRIAVSDRRGASAAEQDLASQPTMSRLVRMLSEAGNLRGLHALVREFALLDYWRTFGHRKELIIDIDSFPREAHGYQEGAVYNGHYHETCFHPIVAFADGHVLDARMRPGNAHTADDALDFLAPLLQGTRHFCDRLWVRMDAGYAADDIMRALEEQDVRFVARIKNNSVIKGLAASWAAGVRAAWDAAPSETLREALTELTYQAGSWDAPRRIVAVLVERCDRDGELFDNLFFLVTNVSVEEEGAARLLDRYRQRGRAENHIGELVNVVATKVSPHAIVANEVVLLLGLLAYNLMHHVRLRVSRVLRQGLSLQLLRERFLKASTRIVRHARRVEVRIGSAKVEAWRVLTEAFALPDDFMAKGGAAA